MVVIGGAVHLAPGPGHAWGFFYRGGWGGGLSRRPSRRLRRRASARACPGHGWQWGERDRGSGSGGGGKAATAFRVIDLHARYWSLQLPTRAIAAHQINAHTGLRVHGRVAPLCTERRAWGPIGAAGLPHVDGPLRSTRGIAAAQHP